MARSETETLLPLDSWARIMQVNPWEFNQIGAGFPRNSAAQCPHVFFQFSWQQDFLSREELGRTIEMAEHMIADELGYWPAPKYIADESVQYPRPYNRALFGGGYTPRLTLKSVELNWKKVQGGGVMARTQIDDSVAVTLSDPDNDSVNELFTVSFATTVTDPNELAIYFTETDRNNEPIAETWRIRPVRVVIAGGTATITGHSSLLIKPDLTTRTDPQVLDVTLASNYVTAVEVQRVYRNETIDSTANTSTQGYALWNNPPCNEPPCTSEYGALCIAPVNAELGFVSVDFNVGASCHGYAPDRLSVSYLAGEPLVNGQMAQPMADIVAHLATALLPVEKCGCERSNRIIAYWRAVGPAPGEGLRENLTGLGSSDNPFGPQRGAIWAWNKVKRLRKLV